MYSPWDYAGPFDFTGDAHILFTGPFYPEADPLAVGMSYALPADRVLDSQGRLVVSDSFLDDFHNGPLSFGNSAWGLLRFTGGKGFTGALTAMMERETKLPVTASIAGMLFPDGYGSVAINVTIPDGWTWGRRDALLAGFGPGGREVIAREIYTAVLPALSELCDRCCPTAKSQTIMPYLNATYAGGTDHPQPGRATLPDKYRSLIFPRSAAPITSQSPWVSEFYWPGSGFSVLASAHPLDTLGKLETLLLHLDVLYARMDNSAAAADRLLRIAEHGKNMNGLVAAEYRLREDYQALVQSSFTYDPHMTQLREALLTAWDTGKSSARAETLLSMARQAVERWFQLIANKHARRAAQLNFLVAILTVISVVSSVDAAVDLWSRFVK